MKPTYSELIMIIMKNIDNLRLSLVELELNPPDITMNPDCDVKWLTKKSLENLDSINFTTKWILGSLGKYRYVTVGEKFE